MINIFPTFSDMIDIHENNVLHSIQTGGCGVNAGLESCRGDEQRNAPGSATISPTLNIGPPTPVASVVACGS